MATTPEVDLVFADLRDALGDLHASRHSPKHVRRTFSRFIDLTQRLTGAMRKEFKDRSGAKWKAEAFPGWTAITELFKSLRNEEQHQRQVHISVRETRFFKISPADERLLALTGTWALTDQLMNSPPDSINLHPADPKTGKMSELRIMPVRVEYRFIVQPHDEQLAGQLKAAGSDDVHDLSQSCFEVLGRYYKFYGSELGSYT